MELKRLLKLPHRYEWQYAVPLSAATLLKELVCCCRCMQLPVAGPAADP